jgi:hypothetical protein
VFDGEVLRPEVPLPLRPAATYVITVEVEPATVGESEGEAEAEPAAPEPAVPFALTEIRRMAVNMGVTDLAERHDWYAHGRLPDETP